MKKENNYWRTSQIYCPNCGTLNIGYMDDLGNSKFQCRRCSLVIVRSYKSRRKDIIELLVPKGSVRDNEETVFTA